MSQKILKRACHLAFQDWKEEIKRKNPASVDNRLKPENKVRFTQIYHYHWNELNRFKPAFDKLKEAIAEKRDRPS